MNPAKVKENRTFGGLKATSVRAIDASGETKFIGRQQTQNPAGLGRRGRMLAGLVCVAMMAFAGCTTVVSDPDEVGDDTPGSDITGDGGGLGGALDSQRGGGDAGGQAGGGGSPVGGGTDTGGNPGGGDTSGDGTTGNSNENGGGDTGGGDTGGNDNGDGDTDGDSTSDGGDDSGWDGTGAVPFEDSPVMASIGTNPVAAALPAGALRIVTVGDSVTQGVGDESADGGGYPRRILDRVGPIRGGSTVLNLGISGWTSDNVIEGIDPLPNQIDAAVAADPDVVCLWIGSNDLWALYEYGPLEGTSRELEVEDLNNYVANIDLLLSRLQQTGAAVYVGLLDDQALRAVIEDRATLPNTTFEERAQMSKQVIRYNNVLIALAKRYGATLVDFNRTTIFTSIETMDPDGIHPNAAGYDVVAGLWYAAMQAAIEG